MGSDRSRTLSYSGGNLLQCGSVIGKKIGLQQYEVDLPICRREYAFCFSKFFAQHKKVRVFLCQYFVDARDALLNEPEKTRDKWSEVSIVSLMICVFKKFVVDAKRFPDRDGKAYCDQWMQGAREIVGCDEAGCSAVPVIEGMNVSKKIVEDGDSDQGGCLIILKQIE